MPCRSRRPVSTCRRRAAENVRRRHLRVATTRWRVQLDYGEDDDDDDDGKGLEVMSEPEGEEAVQWYPEGALHPMVLRKFEEVHYGLQPRQPLHFRLKYLSSQPAGSIRKALRRRGTWPSVVVDLKHMSGTVDPPTAYNDLTMPWAADLFYRVYRQMGREPFGIRAMMVSTDRELYGLSTEALHDFVLNWKRTFRAGAGGDESLETPLPVIHKDLMVHPLQLAEAAEVGAKGVLLVAGCCLPDLEHLLNTAYALGLEAIVEVYNDEEVERSAAAGAGVMVMSNINRAKRVMQKGNAAALLERWCTHLHTLGVVCLAGGGIRTHEDVEQVRDTGADGIVLGEAMMRAAVDRNADEAADTLRHLLTGE
ncbi:hypothetical protein CDCA_CDCA03G0939 [Cyanidium caldarium]|uniref:indole-3-glycerol-phosphate synthase n=1 Tax=Cyanidium caldarium TaxID=2771 RepID=A0AAV9IRH8_CYACA|nr:hypothetical protein CDCA_CDCA03G0939 [Cyanidium caldarium]